MADLYPIENVKTINARNFVKLIAIIRKKSGMSLLKSVRRLGFSAGHIAALERKEKTISPTGIFKVLKALGAKGFVVFLNKEGRVMVSFTKREWNRLHEMEI